ncbi:MAG: CopG family antitoxin [Candidatus Vecturithrix sp.]|jgi:hypothetical protein|nr:CopG family antitoxin [Candidatus Vecturithrix sp.]
MMKNTGKKKHKDILPELFLSYEEAGEFWDSHDSTDYIECLTPVDVEVKLMRRHYEIEVEEDVMKALEHLAFTQHISPAKLANTLLKRQLAVY